MIISIKTYDGYTFDGRLSLPDDGEVSKLVIDIFGAGPNTYNDGFRIPTELFTNNGIGYFSFNKRGVVITNESPFHKVNPDEYKTYSPSNSVEDICSIIKTLKGMERLKMCKVLLNGCSEGAILAPLFALKYPDMVDALFLCGYSNVNMKDMQKYQCSKFENGNAMLEDCFNAVERKDNEWLINNMGVTSEWLSGHYKLTGNKDILPALDLPIFIFHGTSDGFCDVQGVYDIEDTFTQLGKSNLSINVFDNHGHGLEVIGSSDENLSDGRKSLLNAIYNF